METFTSLSTLKLAAPKAAGSTLALVGEFGADGVALSLPTSLDGVTLDLRKAKLFGDVPMYRAKGVTILGGTFASGRLSLSGEGITIKGASFHEAGIKLTDARGVCIEKCEISTGSISSTGGDGLTVRNTVINGPLTDGIMCGGTDNVLIEDVDVWGLRHTGNGKHPDGIQNKPKGVQLRSMILRRVRAAGHGPMLFAEATALVGYDFVGVYDCTVFGGQTNLSAIYKAAKVEFTGNVGWTAQAPEGSSSRFYFKDCGEVVRAGNFINGKAQEP
jgi:hypothetical protein